MFNVWDFVSVPASDETVIPDAKNEQEMLANVATITPVFLRDQLAKFLPANLTKIALLEARPHSNTATNALFLATMPATETTEPELRYLAAFKRELILDYDKLLEYSNETAIRSRDLALRGLSHLSADYHHWYNTWPVTIWVTRVHIRSQSIVALMARLEAIPGLVTLAADPDFVRSSVRVSEEFIILDPAYFSNAITGVELTSAENPVSLKLGAKAQRLSYPASTTLGIREFHRLGNVGPSSQVNQSAGATLVSKHGPNLITIGASSFVLAKDATRVLTFNELGQGVKSIPIELAKATRTLPNLTIEQSVVQSVNIDGLFTGSRLTIAVTTSDSTKVTVAQSRSGTSIGVTAVAVGEANINVSATNEAGTVTVEFKVTVTAASESRQKHEK